MQLLVAGRCELNACTKAGQTPRWLAHSHVLSQVLGAELLNESFVVSCGECLIVGEGFKDSTEPNHGFTTKIASGVTKTPGGRGVDRLGLLCGAQVLPSRFSTVTGGIGVGADRNYPKVVA